MFQSTQICPDPKCNTKMKKNARFFPACGVDVQERQAKISSNRWFAREDEFAAEFNINDLEGFFSKSPLEVAVGQKALIFQDGQFQGEVGQGSYSFESFLGQLNRLGQRKKVRGILLRTSEMAVDFVIPKLPTRESLTVEAELSLGIKIADPTLFSTLMMGKNAFTSVNLRQLLMPQIKQIISEYTRSKGIKEMSSNAQLRQQLTLQIKQNLDGFLLGHGLALGQIQTIAVGHHRFNEHNEIRGNAWLDVDELRLKGEIRQQLDSLYNEGEWQRIEKLETTQQIETKLRDIEFLGEESKFVNRLRYIELLDKVRQADVREAVIEDDAQELLAQLEHEATEKHLKRDDQEINWQHIRALAEIKYSTERETATIEQKRIISFARLQLEQDTETARLQHKIDIARTNESEQQRQQLTALQHQLEQQQLKANELLAQKKRELSLHADDMIMHEREKESERVNRWKDDEKRREGESGDIILTDERNEAERKRLEGLAGTHTRLKDAKARRKLAELAQESTQEINKIEALGKVNSEALIALSSKEQGDLIVSLQRTKSMENMNAEQIMVLVAENSPHVAEALQERYRHANDKAISEQERALFDKLVQQSKTEADRAERLGSEAQRNILEAVRIASNNQQAPTVVVAGAGAVTPIQGQAVSSQSPAKILVCNKCGAENELNSRYCDKCGAGLG